MQKLLKRLLILKRKESLQVEFSMLPLMWSGRAPLGRKAQKLA